MDESLIDHLRAALVQSPANVPLRLSLVRVLLQGHRYAEAEAECKHALAGAADDPALQAGLAEAFYGQGKLSAALVVCEKLVARGQASPQAHLILARVLRHEGDERQATEMYRRARDGDATLRDEQLDLLAERWAPAPDAGGPAAGGPADDDDDIAAAASEMEAMLELSGVDDPSGAFAPYAERPRLTFADVGGMESLKEEIRLKIIHPLQHPEIYAAYGKKTGGGILLFGPPGCGKTYLARATAGEVKARFISVSISDVLDMYVGTSERNLRDIFQSARSNTPAVLFFDEVDALAASRRDMRQSAGRQVINQFLSELDGVDAGNDGVLIMAATNAPWHLDGAFRRPGRFDRILFVPPPDEVARAAILEVQLRNRPAAEVDIATLARKSKDFSGADLEQVIDLAIEEKLKVAIKSGRPEPLTTKDLLSALGRARPSTKEWFAMARNHALYANEGGLYDDILQYLGIKR